MRIVALNEGGQELAELCESVERDGEPIQITRGGKPVAVIEAWRGSAVWEGRSAFERTNGPLSEDFSMPQGEVDSSTWGNPLD